MNLALSRRLLSAEPLSPRDAQAVLGTAETLRRAAEAGVEQPLLKGKNIAVLCEDPGCESANAFAAAASALGARVSRIPADASLRDAGAGGDTARDMARMLGLLYDAVECDDLPPDVAHRLQGLLNVPVYNGLARGDHPLQRLSTGALPPALLVQAMLVQTLRT